MHLCVFTWLLKWNIILFCRVSLAAMHYNENRARPQARNKKGEAIYTLKFPKYKRGGYTVVQKKEDASFGKNYCICLE